MVGTVLDLIQTSIALTGHVMGTQPDVALKSETLPVIHVFRNASLKVCTQNFSKDYFPFDEYFSFSNSIK